MKIKGIEESELLTVNMMIRDEWPTGYFALLSVLPGVKKAIVVDTGSTDGTLEALRAIRDQYPDKVELHETQMPDSTKWQFGRYIDPNPALGHVRAWLARQTKTPFIWLVDGDEIYPDGAVKKVTEVVKNFPEDKCVGFLPLLWFAKDHEHLGVSDPQHYPFTGRLFRTQGFKIEGAFPGEMAAYDGEVITVHSTRSYFIEDCPPFHHMEMVTKPHRRKILSLIPYEGPQPEVFARYGTQQPVDDSHDGA